MSPFFMFMHCLFDEEQARPKAEKFNSAISPLGTINGAFNLRWNDNLYEELYHNKILSNL